MTTIALAGLGTISRLTWIPDVLATGAELVVYDNDPTVTKSIVTDFPGCRGAASWEEALTHADGAAIATWPQTHMDLALTAVDADVRNLMVEKPLATEVEAAQTFLLRCKVKGVTVSMPAYLLLEAQAVVAHAKTSAFGAPTDMHFDWRRKVLSRDMLGDNIFHLLALAVAVDRGSDRAVVQVTSLGGERWLVVITFRSGFVVTARVEAGVVMVDAEEIKLRLVGAQVIDGSLRTTQTRPDAGRLTVVSDDGEQPLAQIPPAAEIRAAQASGFVQVCRGEDNPLPLHDLEEIFWIQQLWGAVINSAERCKPYTVYRTGIV